LQAYSSSRHRSIDSIELVLKLDTQQDLYNRVVLDDSRGAPIRYSTLEPYSIQELQELISSAYQDWHKAGGYFYYTFYRNYPTFWIDLWTIVQKKNPAIIEWYLPEVAGEDIQATQEEGEESEVK
jgi:broad specificity phosphatase PhoE